MRLRWDYGMRKSLHLEIGVGLWDMSGVLALWVNFLWWYVQVEIIR